MRFISAISPRFSDVRIWFLNKLIIIIKVCIGCTFRHLNGIFMFLLPTPLKNQRNSKVITKREQRHIWVQMCNIRLNSGWFVNHYSVGICSSWFNVDKVRCLLHDFSGDFTTYKGDEQHLAWFCICSYWCCVWQSRWCYFAHQHTLESTLICR